MKNSSDMEDSMHDVEYIGFIAGFCTTIAFLPQIVKIVKTKSTKEL